MRIEIDQSGKIENTAKPTVIAFSGKRDKSLIIFAGEKQKLQNHFRKIGKKSPAHDYAVRSYRKKKADVKARSQKILEFLSKTKSGV